MITARADIAPSIARPRDDGRALEEEKDPDRDRTRASAASCTTKSPGERESDSWRTMSDRRKALPRSKRLDRGTTQCSLPARNACASSRSSWWRRGSSLRSLKSLPRPHHTEAPPPPPPRAGSLGRRGARRLAELLPQSFGPSRFAERLLANRLWLSGGRDATPSFSMTHAECTSYALRAAHLVTVDDERVGNEAERFEIVGKRQQDLGA